MRKETGFLGRLFLFSFLFTTFHGFAAAPVANNDSYITRENTSISVAAPGVLGNDSDLDGEALRALLVAAPAHGTVVLNTDGSFIYSPESGFVGADSFTYTAADAGGAISSVAAVILKVQPVRTNCVSEAVPNPAYGATSGGHAIWLPGIGTNFVFTPTPGTFVQFGDGTAILSGTVFSKTNSQNGFVVDVQLSGLRTNPPPGSPKKDLSSSAYSNNDGPIDTARWFYYTNFTGTLTGLSNYAGAVLNIVRTGPSFQVGFGASGKNINFGASAWFNWTVVQQPNIGPRLTTNGQGDFTLDLFTCDDGGDQCVTNALPNPTYANSTRSHAIYLPGIVTDLIFTPAGRFTQNPDGTATITGLAASRSSPRNAFQINVQLSGYTTNVSLGSPRKDLKSSAYIENGGPIDPSTWSYYTTLKGTFTGVSNYAGAVLNIARIDSAFQIGQGANGKNLHFGASSWFKWTVAHQPNSGSMSSGEGDFNLDIVDCPPVLALACPAGSGQAFVPFSSALAVSGGTPPYTFSIVSGSLPPGLGLNPTNGAITGTPTAAGTFDFTAQVVDAIGASALSACSSGCASNNASWDFLSPLGILGTSQSYTINGLTIEAHGYLNNGTSTALYGKNEGGDEDGLGLANSPNFEIQTTNYVQLDLRQLITNGVRSLMMAVGSVQSGEGYNLYGSHAQGTLGTLLLSNGIVDADFFPMPGYPSYEFISVRASKDDVLIAGVRSVASGCTITIASGSRPPVAVDDYFKISADTTLAVPPLGVLTNDFDPDGDSLSAMLVSNPTHGALNLNTNGSFVYVPAPGFSGFDLFTYKALDGIGTSDVARVVIEVNPSRIIIIKPPANQTNCPGETATFTVIASGTALTYQWLHGTNILNGQTNSTLVLPNVSPVDAGTYCVIINGADPVAVTNCALLVINQNVTVTVPPANQTVCSNETALFRVTATGTALTYQWYFGATALAGQTSSALVLSNVTISQPGTYRVVVSGACGMPVTNSAMLTVNQNITVTIPPTNQVVCSNSAADFRVIAGGAELTYQWYFGTNLLGGEIASTLVLSNVTVAQTGTYRVVVSGACGAPVTNSATLTISQNVIVTVPPANQTVCSNGTAIFQVSATGAAISYQWYFGASALAGETGNTLLLSNVTASQAGTYRVVVIGACGAPVTNSATLVVNQNVVVTVPPANQVVCSNGTATFQVTASGAGLAYQWYFGATPLAGQTDSTLVLSNVTPAQVGTYRVVVSSVCGFPTTNSATLTLSQNVIVTVPPANQNVCSNAAAVFQVTATGTGLSYQWYFGGIALMGQTGSTLVLSNVTSAQAGTYRVIVSGDCGAPVTNSATLTVNEYLVATLAPTSQTVCPDGTAMFRIIATGSQLTYQWYLATNALPGGTNSTLVLSNVTDAQAGTYRVVVNSLCGGPVTNFGTLTVSENVIVTVPPANQTVCSNETAIFHVTAAGPELSYQWYFGAEPLAGQIGSTLILSNVTPSQAGTYRVVVSGACGAPVTNSVTLAVNQKVIVTVPPANQTVCPNDRAVFVAIASDPVLGYQWYFGTNILAGQTNNFLALNAVTTNQAGRYSVVVTGSCGTPVTNSALLMVYQTVIVTLPPADQTVCSNDMAIFEVRAIAAGLSFQWYFESTLLAGQTGNTLVIPHATPAETGNYRVVVSGMCGSPVTNSATLTVNANLIVTSAPADQTVCSNSTVQFRVLASGSVLSYQWYFGTNALLGQTNGLLTLSNVTAAVAGTYEVVVNGPCGGPVTNSATLTVSQNVVVTTPPSNQIVCSNETATFHVNAIGAGLSYQWYFGTNALLGQTGSTLVLSNVAPTQAGTYRVIVSGACGRPVTNSATLTINQSVLVTSPPLKQSVCSHGTVVFQVTATGSDLTYQWYFKETPLGGQTNSSLVLSNVMASQGGIYSVVVSGACGAPVTNSTTLTVNQNVIVTVPPVDQEVCPGETATFSVTATGTALTYQWYRGATNGVLNGQTNSTLVVSNVALVDFGIYTVVVSSVCGLPVTNSATLVVQLPVFVNVPPTNQTSFVGSNVVFGVGVSGINVRVLWLFNGTPVGTEPILRLNNLTASQAGTYCAVVSGICPPRITNCATLTLVNRPPVARDDAYTTPEDVPLSVAAPGVMVNDSDPDGDAITAMLLTNPTNGTVILNPDGSFRYIPATNFAGLDVFTYKVNDGLLSSLPATVLIKVEPRPDCPIARDDNYTARKNVTLTVTLPGVLANDTDPDNDVLTAVLVAATTNGTLALLPNGSFTYLPNLNFVGVDHFRYQARDASCGSDEALVTITVAEGLQPPLVSIVSPTNGSVFIAPAHFSVIADATDIDGVVTNVQIFAGTNRIGIFTNAPYLVALTNLPAGTYTFLATATDNDGLSATSTPVTVTVLASPPVTAIGPIVQNRNNGLFEQFVRVVNPTPEDFLAGVRVFVHLAPGNTSNRVWNATGTNNGVPYVDSRTPLPSGGVITNLLIQYYVPDAASLPVVTLTAEPLPFVAAPLPQPRVTNLSQSAGRVTVEFTTVARYLYYLQSSDDLVHWTTIPGVIRGTGGLMRCPGSAGVASRFYRAVVVH